MAQYTQRKDIFEAVNYAVVTHLLLCLTDERLSCNATFSVFGLVTCGSREHGTERGIGPDRAQPRGSALESREFVIKTEVGLGDVGSGSNSDSALGFWMEVGSQDLGKCSDSPPRTHGNAVPKAESVLIGPYRVGRPKQRGNSASKPKSVGLAPIFGLGLGVLAGSWESGHRIDSPPRTRGKAVPKAESVLIGPYRVGRPKQRGNSASKPKSVGLAPIFGLGLGVLAGSRESGPRAAVLQLLIIKNVKVPALPGTSDWNVRDRTRGKSELGEGT
ncbi:hypothetical protein BKA70DRAFT_1223414 [Coprinopsis sp. MPI-PUGE-AT-0042]|nr:hypothetical protein BKA70DRAFT_1223414 [Coprinopsis sp. MPI-PUGE-AT-0042]